MRPRTLVGVAQLLLLHPKLYLSVRASQNIHHLGYQNHLSCFHRILWNQFDSSWCCSNSIALILGRPIADFLDVVDTQSGAVSYCHRKQRRNFDVHCRNSLFVRRRVLLTLDLFLGRKTRNGLRNSFQWCSGGGVCRCRFWRGRSNRSWRWGGRRNWCRGRGRWLMCRLSNVNIRRRRGVFACHVKQS